MSNIYTNPIFFPTQVKQLNLDKDFDLIRSKDFESVNDDDLKGYKSMDPRTYSAPRSQRLILDEPPLQVRNTQPLNNIYTDENIKGINCSGYYKNYENIKGGNIYYYIDVGNDIPYAGPEYIIPCYVEPTIYTTPMGVKYPVYNREPIFKNNRNLFNYTFDQDQCGFREDIMSIQSRTINQNSYGTYNLFKNKVDE
jgi:hypothetical protein